MECVSPVEYIPLLIFAHFFSSTHALVLWYLSLTPHTDSTTTTEALDERSLHRHAFHIFYLFPHQRHSHHQNLHRHAFHTFCLSSYHRHLWGWHINLHTFHRLYLTIFHTYLFHIHTPPLFLMKIFTIFARSWALFTLPCLHAWKQWCTVLVPRHGVRICGQRMFVLLCVDVISGAIYVRVLIRRVSSRWIGMSLTPQYVSSCRLNEGRCR